MTAKIEIEIPQINVYINFNKRIFSSVQFLRATKIVFC